MKVPLTWYQKPFLWYGYNNIQEVEKMQLTLEFLFVYAPVTVDLVSLMCILLVPICIIKNWIFLWLSNSK